MGTYDDILNGAPTPAPKKAGAYDDILAGPDEAAINRAAEAAGTRSTAPRPGVSALAIGGGALPQIQRPDTAGTGGGSALLDDLFPTTQVPGALTDQKRELDKQFQEQNRKTLNTRGFKAASQEAGSRQRRIEAARRGALQADTGNSDNAALADVRERLVQAGLSPAEADAEARRQLQQAQGQRDADREWANEGVALRMAKAQAPARDWGDVANDPYQALHQGLTGILQGGSWLVDQAPGVDTSGFTRAMGEDADYRESLKSPQAQLSNQLLSHSRFGDNLAATLIDNPLAVTDMVAQSAPMALPGMGAGRAAALVRAERVAGKLGAEAAAHRLGQKLIASQAEKAAQLGGIAGETAISGGMGGAQAEQQVNDTPIETLAAHSSRYRELAATLRPEDARAQLAREVGHASALLQGAGTFLGGRAAGKINDALGLEPTYSKALGAPFSLQGVARGTGGEMVEELAQNPLEQIGQNAAQMKADDRVGLLDDVAKQAALGPLAALGQSGTTNVGGAALYHARGGAIGEMGRALHEDVAGGEFGSADAAARGRLHPDNAQLERMNVRPVEGSPGLFENLDHPDVPPFADAVPVKVGDKTYWADPAVKAAMDARAAHATQAYQQGVALSQPALNPMGLQAPVVPGASATPSAQFTQGMQPNGPALSAPNAPALDALMGDNNTPVPPAAPAAPSNLQQARVYTGKLNPVDVGYDVVDAHDLVTSHDATGNENPQFPAELQPRERDRLASLAQIQRISHGPLFDLLSASGKASDGAPIVGDDNVVESGNGRTLGLQQAYAKGKAGDYRKALEENAAALGIDPERLKGMKAPVLVRRRLTPMDTSQRAQFTREANQSDLLGMSPMETAKADAERISDDMLTRFAPSEDGDVLARSNDGFLKDFARALGSNETAALATGDGHWNRAMADRVRNALFAKAYGSDELLGLAAEDADPDMKNVLSALTAAAPEFARAGKDVGTAQALGEAVSFLRRAKREGQSPQEALSQRDAFDGELSQAAHDLALFIAANARRPRELARWLTRLGELTRQEADNRENPTAGLFGETPQRNVEDLARQVSQEQENERAKETQAHPRQGGSLFQEAGLNGLGQAPRQSARSDAAGDAGREQHTAEGQAADVAGGAGRDDTGSGERGVSEPSPVRRNDYHSEPSDAQKQAGNYKKEHVRWHGLDIAIETQAGTMRRGVGTNGKPWEVRLANDYGYIKRTNGADGDPVDVFLGPHLTSDRVFIVNQRSGKGGFDEHKVMLGFDSAADAEAGYLANYSPGWKNYEPHPVEMTVDEFKDWLRQGGTTTPAKAPYRGKPVALSTGETLHVKETPANRVASARALVERLEALRKCVGA